MWVKNKKIILILVSLVIIAGAVFAVIRFYKGKNSESTKPKPSTNIPHIYQTSSTTPQALQEPVGVRTDFASSSPEGFPQGLPIEQKPITIVYSYKVTFEGSASLNKPPHTQLTYSYITKTSALAAGDAFAAYFNANGFSVVKNYDSAKGVYTLTAKKGTSDVFNLLVAVSNKDLNEQVVAVGEIIQK